MNGNISLPFDMISVYLFYVGERGRGLLIWSFDGTYGHVVLLCLAMIGNEIKGNLI